MGTTNTDKKVRLQVEAADNLRREYHFSIEFFVFVENGIYIAYCPSLDISTSAENFNEAISNFYEMFQSHMDWCITNNTLWADLSAHGWRVKKREIVPPKFSQLMRKPEMKRLMDSRIGFEKVVSPVRIPAMA